jgi:hypothetical protein
MSTVLSANPKKVCSVANSLGVTRREIMSKVFGMNLTQKVGAHATVEGHYDAKQQVWVGDVNSVAGSTYYNINGVSGTDSGNSISTSSYSTYRNGQSDNRTDRSTD